MAHPVRHGSWNLTGDKTDAAPDRAAAHSRLSEEFDAWAGAGRADAMERGHLPTASQALSRIPFADVSTFLDLGCGNGFAVRWALQHMPRDGHAFGLDVSAQMLQVAAQRLDQWRTERGATAMATVEWVQAPFDQVPLDDDSVDAAFSNEALYYAPDVDAALREVLRVLRPGSGFWCSIDFYRENTYSADWQDKVGVPMTFEAADGWVRRFEAAGFTAVATQRLLDPSGVRPVPDDADPATRADLEALNAWKTEVGTLLVVGRKPGP